MATAEELLNSVLKNEASVLSASDAVFVIDGESRTINVPDSERLFGVEGDKDVERKYFQCPKIVGDNQDLSQDYILFINYVNANGDPDAYKISDMQVDGNNITFSWLLDENVTKYRGSIQFAFGAIKPGDEAEDPDKNRWNTTINTDCTCLVGLKCTQQVAESNPDALAQIWAAIDELKAGGGGGGTPGKDGVGIDRIEKTNTQGLVDTYTIYLTDESTYTFTVTNGAKGEKGDTGATPNIQIGTVQTLDPGQQATASMTGTPENPLLNLGIPKGAKGDPGEGGGGTVDPEQIKQVVNDYLEENPVSGMTAEQEQQLNQNTTDVSNLKSDIVVKGLSLIEKQLILNLLKNAAYVSDNMNGNITALENMFNKTRKLYEMTARTFDGTGSSVDTGIPLFSSDISFTITADAEIDNIDDIDVWRLFSCMSSSSPWSGITVQGDGIVSSQLQWSTRKETGKYIPSLDSGRVRVVLTHVEGSNKATYYIKYNDDAMNTVTISSVMILHNENLYIGGNKTAAKWKGKISSFILYNYVLPSEEINTFMS